MLTGGGARVVALSSIGHRLHGLDLDDPNFERRDYDKWLAYGQAKSANAVADAVAEAVSSTHALHQQHYAQHLQQSLQQQQRGSPRRSHHGRSPLSRHAISASQLASITSTRDADLGLPGGAFNFRSLAPQQADPFNPCCEDDVDE